MLRINFLQCFDSSGCNHGFAYTRFAKSPQNGSFLFSPESKHYIIPDPEPCTFGQFFKVG